MLLGGDMPGSGSRYLNFPPIFSRCALLPLGSAREDLRQYCGECGMAKYSGQVNLTYAKLGTQWQVAQELELPARLRRDCEGTLV